MGVPATDPLGQLSLPPGFRFFPTDEELLVRYLCKKVAGHHFSLQIIGDIDLYKFDPWDLPSKALFGEKEWYFFSPRVRKYLNGSRPNRVTGSGYWKATGTDKIISSEGRRVGIKKALVFYVGKAPKGIKTNWILHEYRLIESFRKCGSSTLDEWVLCRIYKKHAGLLKSSVSSNSSKEHSQGDSTSSSFDDIQETFSEMHDRFFTLPVINSFKTIPLQQQQLLEDEKTNLQNMGSPRFGWSRLLGLDGGPRICAGNDSCDPRISPPSYVTAARTDEEVQSGVGTQMTGTGYMPCNSFGFAQDTTFPLGYPSQATALGFWQ